ncbi:hypothetical protein INR49_031133, partial [Caranx melampygus]
MNPLDWENAFGRLEKHLDPNNSCVQNSMGKSLRMNTDSSTYCEYSRYTVEKPHNGMGVNVGWKDISSSPPNFYRKEPGFDYPDGEPLEVEEEDSELARKRQELREIEERILMKRAAIALKAVEPFENNPEQRSATCHGESLRDRVNLILQQRHSVSFLSKIQSPKKRMKPSSLFEDHPLKLRVKALMKQRCCDPRVLPKNTEVADVTLHPPSQRVSSAPKEEHSVNKGFQRFLSVLNKGVDINLLSKIVNDDTEDLALGEELLKIQTPAMEKKSEPGTCQQSNIGVSISGHDHTNSGERRTDPPSRERYQNKRLTPPGDEKKNDRRDSHLASCSRSKSPPAVKKKMKKDEEKPKVDEQHEQLQNILKTLGLCLEVEEMSRLADRTQERLYGKKHEGRLGAESKGEQETRQRGPHKNHKDSLTSSSSSSSSSSSPSSSSRTTSRSLSASPSRHCSSHSKHSKQRRRSESRRTDSNQDNKDAQTLLDKDEDRKDPKETSTYCHHPYPQEQTYPTSHPAGFSAFSDYSLAQYSEYPDYVSGIYSAANSYSTYTQGVSRDPSEYSYPQDTHFDFPGSAAASDMVYPGHDTFEDINLLVNPDLSKSEGQIGSASSRCLRVISTKPLATKRCLKEVALRKRKASYIRKCRVWFSKLKERKAQQKKLAKEMKQMKNSVAQVEVSQGGRDHSEAWQAQDEARQPTEEEIKVNLRKK